MASTENSPNEGSHSKDITKVVADHYNKIEEKGLAERQQSRIFFMRNFNNWTKSILIGNFIEKARKTVPEGKGMSVLDIGAGKGGDMLKWKKGEIDHLVCADIAATSLEQLSQRYKDMESKNHRYRERLFTLECIPADCTKIRLKDKYKKKSQVFDICSCQFSFHYCFESYSQVHCMIRNASECLREGGYFIGTTPDSNDLVKRLKDSPTLKFGNEIYSATFKTKDNLPLFGACYDFHLEGVVDCPEFLVYFPAFVEIASQYGLKLLFKKRFDEFFEENCDTREGKTLLNVMNALETLPPFHGQDLVSKLEDDYKDARNRLEKLKSDEDGDREIRVGTLSQSEWEAVSLYVVFAFEKESVLRDKTPPPTDKSPPPLADKSPTVDNSNSPVDDNSNESA